MFVFNLHDEAEFRPDRHVEKILEVIEDGDVTVACWEPGHVSPNHCHPFATEIYLCIEGGGVMRTPTGDVGVSPGKFVVHPPGEVHEYVNGETRTLLFRVRYGADRSSYHFDKRDPGWVQSEQDAAYFAANPVPDSFKAKRS